MGKRRFLFVIFILVAFVVVIVQCTEIKKKDPRGEAYAGSSTCIKCHKDLSNSYVHNAHFKTSRSLPANASTDSLGLPVSNFVFTKNTRLGIEKRKGGLFQVAYINGKEVKAERTDFVFGAGRSAYTFAYWYGNKMMQMPLNYLPPEHQWVNSPGFPTEQIYFGRPIISRCMECHSSYVDKKVTQTSSLSIEEEFLKSSVIAGIDCERCHGPAAKHVEFHEENPLVKKAYDMVNYRALPLKRRIDMCGVCHSGIQLQILTSSFAFKPGDTLKSLPQFSTYNGGEPDVHGNQKQLLEASPCYKVGKAECVSCHDVHGTTKMTALIYSEKCISCHKTVDHKTLNTKEKALLTQNCIDCHMPVKESHAIGFQVSNSKEKIPYRVRTHRIGIYESLVKNNSKKP
jgi:predicted CXXCH cytochrome family protein